MSERQQILWTSAEAAEAVGGRSAVAWTATGVSIDSRTLAHGDLFIALEGPNFDGHDYVAGALAAGAAAAMVRERPPGVDENAPLLFADDTEQGLTELGRTGRTRARARVIAVTGSVGKTGVKDSLAHVLGSQADTHASSGNLNNQIGVPLSLARLPREARFAVIEIGMNHPGEILPLSRLVQPHVAIVTTVAPVHMEFFASVEAIAEAKAEIFVGVERGGAAVINRDNPHFELLAQRARDAGITHVIGFGSDKRAEFRLLDLQLSGDSSLIQAKFAGGTLSYRLNLPGRHWATNSLAVLAAVYAAGADVFAAAAALAEMTPPKGRGARHRVNTGAIEFLLIDDSYNASPVSMAAALRVLAHVAPGPSGRRIAVLGDMLELGARSGEFHRDLADEIESSGVDLVFAAGERMRLLYEALPAERRGAQAGTAAELSPLVTRVLRTGDVVLVKGSAGSRTGLIVRDLLALDRAARAGAADRREPDAV